MDDQFKKLYLGEFPKRNPFHIYLQIWTVYHVEAERVDGHLTYNAGGARAGKEAVKSSFGTPMHLLCPNPLENPKAYREWVSAKLEAVRLVEKYGPNALKIVFKE